MIRSPFLAILIVFGLTAPVPADVGDPQIRTDHPWYPGELAISTFDRLFATQAESYQRVTGIRVDSDEQKALASWFWRNTHYWHGEAGRRDLWGEGFERGRDMRLREYWNGLFGYGFGLCGTTHSQWTAEFEHLFGHGRGRGVGAAGHNAFEVFLQGGHYGKEGRWAMLDHDLSTVVFDESGRRLLGLGEMQKDVDRWIDRRFKPQRQRGWLVCGLHPGDGNSYRKYAVAEYLAGYAGPPPMVHLRRGERMRRYFEPGLENGKTFVFWGRNYNTDGIAGPERSRTWVNQPDRMYRSTSGTAHRNGQARFANVQYVYRPNFATGDYREGVVEESEKHVVFEYRTPYIIGATPPNNEAWGIYQKGCRNGLVLGGNADCEVSISLNAGRTWLGAQRFNDGLDLTDFAKGRSQYWLRFATGAKKLIDSDLEIRTVCQANVAVLPRLKDNGTKISYEAGRKTVFSLGPELDLAKTFVADGAFAEKTVTLTATPNKPVIGVYAAAHAASGSPPDSKIRYLIEYSLDSGKYWEPIVKDWSVPRRGDEPGDFWSQSFCYGSSAVESESGKPILIRFRNNGGKRYLRAEAHFTQKTGIPDPVEVTYTWTDADGEHQESHVFASKDDWQLATGKGVRTRWVEFRPVQDGAGGADREAEWVAPMKKVHSKYRGEPGVFAQFGDSITNSRAFWFSLRYKRNNASPEMLQAFKFVSSHMIEDCWDRKGPENGNQGGKTIRWAHQNVSKWLKKLNPEVAIVMFGTNDLNSVPSAEYTEKMRDVVQRCLDNGTVVILSTLPARRRFTEKAAKYAEIVRSIASELKVPLIDYHAEILKRRPDDWDGALDKFKDYQGYDVPTLIARDGVHPSAPKKYRGDYSKESLNRNGFALRNYLTLLKYGEVVERVLATK